MVQKCPFFVNIHTIENVHAGGYVVKKIQNLVNVVCEQPLGRQNTIFLMQIIYYTYFFFRCHLKLKILKAVVTKYELKAVM